MLDRLEGVRYIVEDVVPVGEYVGGRAVAGRYHGGIFPQGFDGVAVEGGTLEAEIEGCQQRVVGGRCHDPHRARLQRLLVRHTSRMEVQPPLVDGRVPNRLAAAAIDSAAFGQIRHFS